MENTTDLKTLSDLIKHPDTLSAIMSNPAEEGLKFYQSLTSKDKQYVIFAAALGLIAYGLYLNRTSLSEAISDHTLGKAPAKKNTPRELNVKKSH